MHPFPQHCSHIESRVGCCRKSKEAELVAGRQRLSLIQQDLHTVDELDGVPDSAPPALPTAVAGSYPQSTQRAAQIGSIPDGGFLVQLSFGASHVSL